MNAALQQYLDLYVAYEPQLRTAPDAMNRAREAALQLLRTEGLPPRHSEQYKYTDAATLIAPDYGLNLLRHTPQGTPKSCSVPGLHTQLFHVAGDVVLPISAAQDGVEAMTFREAAERRPELLQKYYHQAAAKNRDALTALNTLLAQDGLLIHIKAGTSPALPLQIVNIASTKTAAMHNRRLVVVCESGSEASLLLCDHCDTTAQTLTTQVSEFYLGEGARLDVYSVEETNAVCHRLHHIYAEQATRSHFSVCDVTLRAGLSRTMANVELAGVEAESSLAGAIVAGGTQHIDNNLLIAHRAEGCTSEMLYKSVIDDESTCAFAGKVLVASGAQKSVSQQTSANLCVSPTARALTQPMLEIYADDVKCNHGATVGKLDETALLYMRQRGIGEEEARLLLQHAFVSEVISRIHLPALRDRLTSLIDQRFRGSGDAHCAGCGLCGK